MAILQFNKDELKDKLDNFWWRTKVKASRAAEWVRDNPETAGIFLTAGTALVGGVVKIGKGLIRSHNLRKEQFSKERYIYDRSLGMYLRTKRPLRNKDYMTINQRRRNGEKLSKILEDMHILE